MRVAERIFPSPSFLLQYLIAGIFTAPKYVISSVLQKKHSHNIFHTLHTFPPHELYER